MTTSRRPPQAAQLVRTSAPVKRSSQAMQRTTIRSSTSASVFPVSIELGRVVSTALVTRDSLNETPSGAARNSVQAGRIPPLFRVDMVGRAGAHICSEQVEIVKQV